ncbi:hypothetical protein AMR72_05285 [Flavobacterium psychrophilum]|nr:hypothetical protein AMR72_05285 [Flavobacterium psychrophilum]AOE51984.1 hypothetical protein ALW18_05280 [Flavobacterium psychrophilum]
MRKLLSLLFILFGLSVYAQPKLELTPRGFDPVEVTIPSIPPEKFIELSKSWTTEYNRRLKGADVTNVTDSSLTISAFKKNAFFFRNRGEMFEYTINYSMKITFSNQSYTLQFIVNDIYTDDDTLVKYKLPDYFNSSGELKEGYADLKPSLERTVNSIVASHYNFIANFK